MNIQLGKGKGLDTFNDNIVDFNEVSRSQNRGKVANSKSGISDNKSPETDGINNDH